MTQFPQNNITYRDLEPAIEAAVNEPLPDGLIEPEWLAEPEIEPEWLTMPEIEPEWLTMPEIEPEWLVAITPQEQSLSIDTPHIEQDFDLEH